MTSSEASANDTNDSPGRGRLALLLLVGTAPFLLNGFYNGPLAQTVWLYWCVELITWVALPVGLFLVGRRAGLFDAEDLGFHNRCLGQTGWVNVGWWSFLLAVMLIAAYSGALGIGRRILPGGWDASEFSYRQLLPEKGVPRLLVAVYLALSAGVVEELYFRGILRRLFPRGAGGASAFVVVSALCFALAHWENGPAEMVATLVLGACFSVAYLLGGNIWPVISAHAAIDMLWFTDGFGLGQP